VLEVVSEKKKSKKETGEKGVDDPALAVAGSPKKKTKSVARCNYVQKSESTSAGRGIA